VIAESLHSCLLAVLQINTRACAGIRQRKVHFHWVLRSADSMYWLEKGLEAVAMTDRQRRFELRVHLTGLLPAAVVVSRAAAG
jgi:hypothetical protein